MGRAASGTEVPEADKDCTAQDLLFGVPPPQPEEGSCPVEHLMETLRGARGRAYPQGEAAHWRQEQGTRPRMKPPFYSMGSKASPVRENPAARVPRNPGAPASPKLGDLARYMGPAGPRAMRGPEPREVPAQPGDGTSHGP
ncbi:unnamed protein product [Lampetra fluviatilis]